MWDTLHYENRNEKRSNFIPGVTSATYANTTEKVTAKTPDIEIMAKYHQVFICMSGMGAHVKNTVKIKNNFLPHTSDNAPINGALKKDRSP